MVDKSPRQVAFFPRLRCKVTNGRHNFNHLVSSQVSRLLPRRRTAIILKKLDWQGQNKKRYGRKMVDKSLSFPATCPPCGGMSRTHGLKPLLQTEKRDQICFPCLLFTKAALPLLPYRTADLVKPGRTPQAHQAILSDVREQSPRRVRSLHFVSSTPDLVDDCVVHFLPGLKVPGRYAVGTTTMVVGLPAVWFRQKRGFLRSQRGIFT